MKLKDVSVGDRVRVSWSGAVGDVSAVDAEIEAAIISFDGTEMTRVPVGALQPAPREEIRRADPRAQPSAWAGQVYPDTVEPLTAAASGWQDSVPAPDARTDDLEAAFSKLWAKMRASVAGRLRERAVPVAMVAHLPGRHDQSSHGNGSTGIGEWKDGELLSGESGGAKALLMQSRDKKLSASAAAASPEDAAALAAVNSYSMFGHATLNRGLRGEAELEPHVAAKVGAMDAAIERLGVKTAGPVTVYRGAPGMTGLTPGTRVVDPGFMSTTGSREVAEEFARNGPVLQLELTVGTQVLAGATDEVELILPRNAAFTVESVSEGVVRLRSASL